MRLSSPAVGLLCMLLSVASSAQPQFNYHHIPKAEDDHTYQPGLFSRFKVLTEREIVSADREIGGKKLVVNFYRYDRATGALLGTSKTEVAGGSPRFERLLQVNGHIYMLFTTREEKTQYKVYALVYDEATGTVAQERHLLGELDILNRLLDMPFADVELRLRFEVSDDQHRVLMFNDELKTPDSEERRVLSLWVFDDLLQPVWKTSEVTPSKYKDETFSDLEVTNEGEVYALNVTDLTESGSDESAPGNYTLYHWSSGQLNKARIETPQPWHPIIARMSWTGNDLLVTGFHADANAPKERATAGAFMMRFGNDLTPQGVARVYPLPSTYDHPLTNAKQVTRPDGGCYITNLERATDGPSVNIDTGVLVFSISPSGEQEGFWKIPRAQRTQYQAIFWAGGGQGFYPCLWNNQLMVAFYDTEANVNRYSNGQLPEMTDDRKRTTMSALLDAKGTVSYARITPPDHCAFAAPLEDEPGQKELLLQSSRLNEDGRSYSVGFGVAQFHQP